MTQANPFDAAPPTPLASARELSERPELPLHLVGVVLLVSAIGIVITLAGLLSNSSEYLGDWLLRYAVRNWVSHLLLAGLSVYWLTQVYLERNGLGNYRQPGALLIVYGLACLALSWLGGYAMSYLYMWRYQELSDAALSSFLWWNVDWLRLVCDTLLPLWLLLHLFRYTAEARPGLLSVTGNGLAWCFSLGIVVAYLQLTGLVLQLLSGVFYNHALEGWEGWIVLGHGLLYLLVAFFSARGALPAQVLGFRGGRLALACLLTMLLWIASAVVCAVLMLALLLAGGGGEDVLLILLGLLQLALLWPFTRLGLRWGYRAQAAA